MNTLATMVAAVALLTMLPASSASVTLQDGRRGWYRDTGYTEVGNSNYLVGECTPDACGFAFAEYRNFFLFDVSAIDQRIASASLLLWLPPGGFISPTDSEVYELFDVLTDPDDLGRFWGVEIFDDLGTGTSYGSHVATDTDESTWLEVPLNAAALLDLNAAGALFALGGAVTSLDDLTNDELLFGQSGNRHAYLVLETVPLPGAVWLLASALLLLVPRRCASSWRRWIR
jgi:hypothetical protein